MFFPSKRLYPALCICETAILLHIFVELGTAYLALESVSTLLGLGNLESNRRIFFHHSVQPPGCLKFAPPESDL